MKYNINFSSFDRNKELQRKAFYKGFWVLTFLLLAMFIYGFIRFYKLSLDIDNIEKEKTELSMKIEKAKEERKRIISDSEIVILKNKLTFYQSLQQRKFSPTIFFNILEKKTPKAISLIYVDYDVTRKSFILSGETLSPEISANYLSSLNSVDIFKQIELTRQNMQRIKDKNLVIGSFEIKGVVW